MTRRLGFLFLWTGLTLAGSGAAFAQLPPDNPVTRTLPEPGANWAYIVDLAYPSAMIAKLDIIDGDSHKFLGQLSGGMLSNFTLSPDHKELYLADTYYSRGTRGTRTDVVSIFDAKTLDFLAEVAIPPKRLLVVVKRDATGVTTDGRFLLVSNLTPATSVSVVDLKSRTFAGEIDTPGCTQVLASGPRHFISMCADGSLLSVDLDDTGKLAAEKQGRPFFDAQKDPVFDMPVLAGNHAWFVSFHGLAYDIDLSAADPKPAAPWKLIDDKDTAGKWRPGGWQMMSVAPKTGELFVLMHQGGEWTHKQFGSEVWVFDTKTKKRTRRIKMKTPAYSIMASRADHPVLFAMALPESRLETYSAADGKYLGKIDNIGTPFLLYGP